MVLAVMALIVFVAIFIVGYPLVNAQQYEYADVEFNGNDTLEHLASARNSVFEAIRDLEFDRATGKLSDEDYHQLRARYDVKAAQVLQQIDAFAASKKDYTKARVQKAGAGKNTCPRCHQRVEAGDRFCPTCGARLN
jgi:zinc-ribbon domain